MMDTRNYYDIDVFDMHYFATELALEYQRYFPDVVTAAIMTRVSVQQLIRYLNRIKSEKKIIDESYKDMLPLDMDKALDKILEEPKH